MTTLQRFRAAMIEGRELNFRRFVWGQKPSPTVKRRVMKARSRDVIISSERDPVRGSHLDWPKASEVVEHAPGVFFVLNGYTDNRNGEETYVALDVMVYDFSEPQP